MYKFIFTLLAMVPLLTNAQKTSYSLSLAEVKALEPGASAKHTDATLKKNEIDKAKIEITGVSDADVGDLILYYKKDTSKIISPQALDSNRLVYLVKDELDAAQNMFELNYKGNKKVVFQFKRINDEENNDGGDDDETTTTSKASTYIAALAGANFVGNNKFLANLTPVVNLGSIIPICKKGEKFRWDLDVNPYLGAQIDTKDSVSFIPALMLPGRAGLQLNNYLTWGSEKAEFTWMPVGFGLKVLPGIKDSTINIWQHNIRTGIALRYEEEFLIGAQLTYGFHNTTSESKKFYKTVFSKNATDILYLTLTGQFKIKSNNEAAKENYLFVEWRGLLSKKKYPAFDNIAILTFGFRKNLSLGNAMPVSTGNRKRIPALF